jgi:hypothetical protein
MMADEAVTKILEENKKRQEASRKEAEERLSKGKPTPTQEEVDRAALGEHVLEKEDDGSGPDPADPRNREVKAGTTAAKTAEAEKPATYATRQTTAKPTPSGSSST